MGKDPEIGAPELSLDLFRTFSTHSVLSSKRALEAVRRIVTAYGRRNHTNAYSSNVNYIAAFLLAVLSLAKEEEAFWILTALLERRLPASSVLEVCPSCALFLQVLQLWPACFLLQPCPV